MKTSLPAAATTLQSTLLLLWLLALGLSHANAVVCPTAKTVECGATWDFDPPTGEDNPCEGQDITITVVSTVTNGTPCQWVITRGWQIIDLCDNTNTCSQTVTVTDTTPPVITCAADKTVEACCFAGANLPTLSLIHSFTNSSGDGQQPAAEVIEGSDGMLYGMTTSGGAGYGTVYKVNKDGSGYATVWSFGYGSDSGQYPSAGLFEASDHRLYGVTPIGGAQGWGMVFGVDRDGQNFQLLHSFLNSPEGRTPHCTLLEGDDGYLYGTTQLGGADGIGSVFKLKKNGDDFQTLHSFVSASGQDGGEPRAGLALGADHKLYGTTYQYGQVGAGTVFSLNQDGTDYRLLWDFNASGAANPTAALIIGRDGVLYGTTQSGGPIGVGTVFKLNRDGSGFRVLHGFGVFAGPGPDGAYPDSRLWEGCDGALYGTTPVGGMNYPAGIIYKVNRDGSGYQKIWENNGATPNAPYVLRGGLTAGSDGALYGVSSEGGQYSVGEIYQLSCGPSRDFDPPTASDDCCTNATISVVSTVTNGVCPKVITRTWQATDCCGYSSTCSQAITLLHTVPPVITCVPDKTAECSSAWSFDEPTASSACGGTVTITVLETVTNGSGCEQTITRTWAASDGFNMATCSQTVTVLDTTPPVLTCAGNKTVECGSGWEFDLPAALDTCGSTNVILSVVSDVTNGACPTVIMRTWLATDACGNTNSCSQTVTVQGPLQYTFTTLAGLAGNYGSADGTGSAARFDAPHGVAVDSAGNVYVADTGNDMIRKVTPAGVVTTLAGLAGNYGSADGTGSAARFHVPWGVALDSAGNVYVADEGNNTIRKMTPEGIVTTLAGSAYFSGSADGTGSSALFYAPRGVAVDSAGNLYVADTLNHTIRKVTPAGVVTTLAGLAFNQGSTDGTGSAARFYWPSGVAGDSAGNAYVADTENYTIRKVTPAGVATTLAGLAGHAGSADGTASAARFDLPFGVAVDSAGDVYVADHYNHTIRKVTSAGVVTTLAGLPGIWGSADGTGSAARFYAPFGVAVDSAGNIYVADTSNHTIRKGVPTPVPPLMTCSSNKIVECGSAWSFDPPTAYDACSGNSVAIAVLSTVTNGMCPTVITRTWLATCVNTSSCSQTVTVALPGPITVTVALAGSGDVQLSFNTFNGLTYLVEYKDNLDAPSWTTRTSVPGNGSVATVLETRPLLHMRFYRVHQLCP